MPDNTVWVSEHPGVIEMPDLVEYFDWSHFAVDCPKDGAHFKLGSRNMKSTFTTAARFLGYEKLLLEQPDLAPIADSFYEWNRKLLLSIDVITFFEIGDDVAGSTGLIMAPALWRTWIKPHLQKLVLLAKRNGCKVMYHSDGDIAEILPDLLDLDFEILNFEPTGRMVEFENQPKLKSMQMQKHNVERDQE